MTESELREKLKDSMRARDKVRTRVLRAVISGVKNAVIEKRGADLDDGEMLAILKREVKQTREQVDFARQAGRDEAVAEHTAEVAVLEELLPRQLDEAGLRSAIEAIVSETGATSIGPVMKELGARHAGCYDGKTASSLIREILA